MSKTKNPIAATMEHMMPVGTIIEWAPVSGGAVDLSTADKVRAYYGFGTWEAYGEGRMLLGCNTQYKPGATGGNNTHTHSLSRAVALIGIDYGQDSHNFIAHKVKWADTPYECRTMGNLSEYTSGEVASIGTEIAGTTDSTNAMPPYISVYRWRRIA